MQNKKPKNNPDNCHEEQGRSDDAFISRNTHHRNLIDYMRNGYAYCQIIYEKGDAVDFIHEEVNKGYEQLTGLKNVVGRKITEVLPGILESNPEFLEKHFRVVETGIPDQFEIYLEALKKWFDISVYSPKKGYFVAMFDDISERKRQEIELKKMCEKLTAAKEHAEECGRLKTAFLANISHEIRTPMNGILGFSELLKDPYLSGEEHAEYVDLIYQSGQRMQAIINDLIDITRIEAGEAKLQIAETPVNRLFHFLHGFFKPEIDKKGLYLNCTTALPDEDSILLTDGLKLNQILTNLIQNALKFTDKGGIDFGYTRKDGTLQFYVIDSGIGIPDNMKEKIFERFRRVDNPLNRRHEGAGLGLHISRGYVEMLGGTIWVESIEGKGSKFFFTLPCNLPVSSVKQSHPPIIQDIVDAVPGVTILIAEDETMSSFLLKKILKGEHITILSAVNGQEAVVLVDRHPEINLVLIDIQMPVMDGFEATSLIKKIRPELPVIVQTAVSTKETIKKAAQAGCDGFITKPINMNKLLEMMQELLNR
ncbi:MAG: response regulator [Chlorobiaceae bacterium]|jgi:signal transduction histidine kinase/CheY-like chemotaxis protein|nr:response regulator [Chlorobiaceae bacterium]